MASTINAKSTGAGGLDYTGDSSGVLGLQTGGVTAVTVDASQNVGIGTTSPSVPIDIVSNSSAGIATRLRGRSSDNTAILEFTNNGASAETARMAVDTSGNIAFSNTGTVQERMRIDSSGNVGIGTSSPSRKLQIKGIVGFEAISGSTNVWENYTYSDNTLRWNYNGSGADEMVIDSSGNVGIGTTSPSTFPAKLAVQGYVASGGQNYSAGFSDAVYSTFRIGHQSGLTNLITDTALALYTSNTERMRIDASGYFSIRQTSNSGAEVLGIQGNGDTQIGLYCTPTTLYTQINFRNGNGVVGTVRTTGTSTQFNTSSDYRLKENVSPMEGALNKVMQLKPVTFTWKTDGLPGQGFIAHELQEIVPDAVGGEKDAVDKNGNPDYQGVDASFLVATLTKAIQELKAIVDAQQQEINALKGAQ